MSTRILTISAAMGLVLAAAGGAQAQPALWSSAPAAYANDDYRASYADAQRAAYDNGYRDGLKRGEQAARDGRAIDVEREREYRSGENGYNRSHGDRNRYRDNYRGGFAQGFRDGYDRRGGNRVYSGGGGIYDRGAGYGNPGYGNPGYGNPGYGNPGYGNSGYGRPGYGGTASYGAYQNGVSDGYQKGLDDLNDRKRPDVTRQKWYRNADHDYNSRYGSKEMYRVDYRRGFEDGYNRAYRERGRY